MGDHKNQWPRMLHTHLIAFLFHYDPHPSFIVSTIMLIENIKGFVFSDWRFILFKSASCDVTFNKFIMKARQRDWLRITDT